MIRHNRFQLPRLHPAAQHCHQYHLHNLLTCIEMMLHIRVPTVIIHPQEVLEATVMQVPHINTKCTKIHIHQIHLICQTLKTRIPILLQITTIHIIHPIQILIPIHLPCIRQIPIHIHPEHQPILNIIPTSNHQISTIHKANCYQIQKQLKIQLFLTLMASGITMKDKIISGH